MLTAANEAVFLELNSLLPLFKGHNRNKQWGGIEMRNSKNSLLGVIALGTAAYLFRNKASRDKVMNQIQSLVTPENREKVMNQIRSFTGTNANSSTENQKNTGEVSGKPNAQAMSTAETMNEQTSKHLDSNKEGKITEVNVSK